MSGLSSSGAYRAAAGIAVATSLLTVWTTIVRDDGNGLGSFGVIIAAAVGAFAAWFRPAGLARTMAGVAAMHLLIGVGIATAPSTADLPGGPLRAMAWAAVLAALWLASGALFRVAARNDGSVRPA